MSESISGVNFADPALPRGMSGRNEQVPVKRRYRIPRPGPMRCRCGQLRDA